MKTILITGCSSGFGLEIAKYFLAQGWRVVATMRTPRTDLLPVSQQLNIVPMDVTDPQAIRAVIEAAGPIDVLVNNAGIGMVGPVERVLMQIVREVFETNVLGMMAVTQATLPQMRERGRGVIINISSSITLKTIPLTGMYAASKAAVNTFTQCLALEMRPFGVRAHAVLPGRSPQTPFAQNGRERMQGFDDPAYANHTQDLMGMMDQQAEITYPVDVVGAVWRAAHDETCPTLLPVGTDALAWAKAA